MARGLRREAFDRSSYEYWARQFGANPDASSPASAFAQGPLNLAIDVKRDYGASGSAATTTGSMTAGSNTLTITGPLPTGSDAFRTGQGISVANAGAMPTISAPTAATATAEGTTGTTTIDYAVAALDGRGGVTASFTFSLTNANATLSATNYVALAVTAVSGAAGYAWWRTSTNGTSPTTTGYIGQTSGPALNDTGLAVLTPPTGIPSAAPSAALGDLLVSQITTINGSTFTLADAAGTTVSGAIVSHDDTAAVQAAITAAESSASGFAYVDLDTGHFILTSALSLNAAKTGLRGNGATLDFSSASPSTTAVTMVGDTSAPPDVYNQDRSVQLDGLLIIGPGQSTPSTAILAQDVANQLPFCTLRNVLIRDFGTGLEIGTNCWLLSAIKCAIAYCGTGLSLPSGTSNSGESIALTDCAIFNSATLVNCANGDADVYLTNCSLDYPTDNGIVMSDGHVELSGCHMETSVPTGYMISLGSSGNGILIVRGGNWVAQGTWTDADYWGNSTGMPAIIDNVDYSFEGTYTAPYVFTGTGPLIQSGGGSSNGIGSGYALPALSPYNVNYNHNLSASSLAGFVFYDPSNPPTYDATGGASGGPAIKISLSSPGYSRVAVGMACKPGQIISVGMHYSSTSSNVQILVQAYAEDGSLIGTIANPSSGATTGYQYLWDSQYAPAGTAYVVAVAGIVNSTGTVYIDDFWVFAPGCQYVFPLIGVSAQTYQTTLVSGTVYQNLYGVPITVYLPAYASISGTAGTVAVAMSYSNSPATLFTQQVPGTTSSSEPCLIGPLRVPVRKYFSFTASGATFLTATINGD